MKGKILTLLIGIIIGVIITTAGFFVYNKLNSDTPDKDRRMQREQMQKDGNVSGKSKGKGSTKPSNNVVETENEISEETNSSNT